MAAQLTKGFISDVPRFAERRLDQMEAVGEEELALALSRVVPQVEKDAGVPVAAFSSSI